MSRFGANLRLNRFINRLNEFNKETCLVIVFNHKYEQNIEKLEKLYRGRFRHIFYIVPFYQGDRADVISVYESSYRFQGYIAQASKTLFDEKFSHYVFIADDMILHPNLNESNILHSLSLGIDSAYIKQLQALSDVSFEWGHLAPVLNALDWISKKWYVEFRPELPEPEHARELLRRHGVEVKPVAWSNLRGASETYNYGATKLLRGLDYLVRNRLVSNRKDTSPSFPLAMSYSDFFVVPSKAFAEFCHYCGVFAAMNLFVEVSIPTALALSCTHIVRETDVAWRGVETWDEGNLAHLPEAEKSNFKNVLDSFNDHQLYLHPVKLSRWRNV